MHPVAKLVEDMALEASGLSSVKRLYEKDVKPMISKRKKPWKKNYPRPPQKQRRPTARSQIGKPVTAGDTQRRQIKSNGIINKDGKTLYSSELTRVPEAVSAFSINTRQRAICNISGFSLCFEVRNNLTSPLYFHWAVIAPRANATVGTGTDPVPPTDFFRGMGTKRGSDAVDGLTALEWTCLPINTDKYNILRHNKRLLAPVPDPSQPSYSGNSSNSYTTIDDYVKLARQVRYEGDITTDGATYLVYWCAEYGDGFVTGGPENAASIAEHHVTYFRESGNFF